MSPGGHLVTTAVAAGVVVARPESAMSVQTNSTFRFWVKVKLVTLPSAQKR